MMEQDPKAVSLNGKNPKHGEVSGARVSATSASSGIASIPVFHALRDPAAGTLLKVRCKARSLTLRRRPDFAVFPIERLGLALGIGTSPEHGTQEQSMAGNNKNNFLRNLKFFTRRRSFFGSGLKARPAEGA
jgi:hypothetical protein